jgi:hypothetical protein
LKGKERKKPRESDFPVAFQWKPVHCAVDSIVLRLFKNSLNTRVFEVFLCFCQQFLITFPKNKGAWGAFVLTLKHSRR